jgi:hypothetical protein
VAYSESRKGVQDRLPRNALKEHPLTHSSILRPRPLRALALATAVSTAIAGTGATAQNLTFETGLERFSSPKTLIEGLNRIYVGYQFTPNLSLGQSFYSAALGDAGGAFFWGVEGVARLPLSNGFSVSASGFLGGGGGAVQVIGDGTMWRAGLALDYQVTDAWAVQLMGAWVNIEGAPIDGPTFGIGLRRQIGDGTPGSWTPSLDAAGLVVTGYTSPSGTLNRPGGQQDNIALVGARALFALGSNTQLSLGASGAGIGAEGYMQVTTGLRRNFDLGGATVFVEGSAGFGGGGNVDTGAGPLLEAAAGISVPVTRQIDAQLSFGGIVAPTGTFRAAGVSLGIMRNFARTRAAAGLGPQAGRQRWAYSGGISVQQTGANYFTNLANTANYVVMQESSFDYFLGDALYVSGNGQTTLQGGTAGYAIGMLGLGYQIDLGQRMALSLEGHLGAAGGGGVNTAGGVVGSLRAELDYYVTDRWAVSLGVGHLAALRGTGLSSNIATLGIKIPFTTR